MGTRNVNSAVFANASGPHGPPIPLPPYEPGFYGLGQGPEGQDLDWLGARGIWGGDPIIAPGQAQKFQVAWQVRRPITFDDASELRGRIEARAERQGLWTRCLKLSPEHMPLQHGLWVWTAGPKERPIASSTVSTILRDAVRAELPLGEGDVTVLALAAPALAAGFVSTPWPPVGLGGPTPTPPDKIVGPDWRTLRTRVQRGLRHPTAQGVRGLGDSVLDQLSRGFTNVSVETLCSPAFQAVAAQGVATRYGEDQARQFRSAFRQATRFCDPAATARFEAERQAEEDRKTLYAGGVIALVAAGLFAVWAVTGKKPRNNNRRRRNKRRGRPRKRNQASVAVTDKARGEIHVWEGGSNVAVFDSRSGRLAGRYEVLPWIGFTPSAAQVRDKLKRICRRR